MRGFPRTSWIIIYIFVSVIVFTQQTPLLSFAAGLFINSSSLSPSHQPAQHDFHMLRFSLSVTNQGELIVKNRITMLVAYANVSIIISISASLRLYIFLTTARLASGQILYPPPTLPPS